MSKAKRVMQQNTRAAFVLTVTIDDYFRTVIPRLRPRGIRRIVRWGGQGG